ncbi:hypothetical protein [Actinoplanes utahensis]|uniref:Uncharacterized protein n=1 Tax=Actinoplanes utahensis TaxID=1869 RepID=A0A0A6UH05_ACTUT|nr:hypothetical protein [Actinoplanes utahensis]KHD75290.1 hypothetical protein MB27_23810 [Actinoplanes utahensis]GIF30456.1 hypothetical protein Aut01nite_34420 [Actinoplanes utahensis]
MTSQMPDLVRFRGTEFIVTAVDGTVLFDPQAYGHRPVPLGSACWRGFFCEYTVNGDRLELTTVCLGPSDGGGRPPVLFGTKPGRASRIFRSGHGYTGLAAPVAFTGRLLLGDGHVAVGYLNMGFRPAWLCAEVVEAHFTDGVLTAEHDRSAAAAEVRDRLGEAGLRPRDDGDRGAWIDRTFSLSFDYSLPTP